MARKWIYSLLSNYPIAVTAVIMFCGGVGCGLLFAKVLSFFNKDCDFKEPTCVKGNLLPAAEAVLYKPFWISAEFGNKTETNKFASEEEVVLRTAGQAETIVIDCQTEDPFWWTSGMTLKLFLLMQNKPNQSSIFPSLPKFWIRLAVSGIPGKENDTVCVNLIKYAISNSISNFQGVLIEANQLLNFSAGVDEKKEDSKVWNIAEKSTIEFWKRVGKYQIGLLMDSYTCNDVFKKIPKTLLYKFNKIFYLDGVTGVDSSEEVPVVSVSKGYKTCKIVANNEFILDLVISDMANVFGYADYPICITDKEV